MRMVLVGLCWVGLNTTATSLVSQGCSSRRRTPSPVTSAALSPAWKEKQQNGENTVRNSNKSKKKNKTAECTWWHESSAKKNLINPKTIYHSRNDFESCLEGYLWRRSQQRKLFCADVHSLGADIKPINKTTIRMLCSNIQNYARTSFDLL